MANKARFTSRAPQFISRLEQKAARAMAQATSLVRSEASVRTPIDTSNLLNSQYAWVRKEGTRIVGNVGYTAEYALPVHDPENPQTFRRASATKLFLTEGVNAAQPAVRRVLRGELRVGRAPK